MTKQSTLVLLLLAYTKENLACLVGQGGMFQSTRVCCQRWGNAITAVSRVLFGKLHSQAGQSETHLGGVQTTCIQEHDIG